MEKLLVSFFLSKIKVNKQMKLGGKYRIYLSRFVWYHKLQKESIEMCIQLWHVSFTNSYAQNWTLLWKLLGVLSPLPQIMIASIWPSIEQTPIKTNFTTQLNLINEIFDHSVSLCKTHQNNMIEGQSRRSRACMSTYSLCGRTPRCIQNKEYFYSI